MEAHWEVGEAEEVKKLKMKEVGVEVHKKKKVEVGVEGMRYWLLDQLWSL